MLSRKKNEKTMDLAVLRILECFGKIHDFIVAEDIKSEQAASGGMFKQ